MPGCFLFLRVKYPAEVIFLNYNNLDDLLQNNPQARSYFDALTTNMKQQLRGQSKNIDFYDGLKAYAENQGTSTR
jgi:hypothetical protein